MLNFIQRCYLHCATLVLAFCMVSIMTSAAFGQLQFNFVDRNGASAEGSVDQVAFDGFQAAADRWSSIFNDPITVNIEIAFEQIPSTSGATILGSTGPSIVDSTAELNGAFPTFSLLKDALGADVTSPNDVIAFGNLPVGQQATIDGSLAVFADGSPVTSLVFGTNDRAGTFRIDDDTEIGGDNPDNNTGNNNTFFGITSANAKALGLVPGDDTGIDAQIRFNSDVSFDFDPNDGITLGQIDFIGVATHEIAHALGIISGVDLVDTFSGSGPSNDVDLNGAAEGVGELDRFALFSTFDLYRRSGAAFLEDPDALDLSTGDDVFFSIDRILGNEDDLPLQTGAFNGTTAFSNGIARQASHLADGLDLGILDPTAAPGELLGITENDILLLDVIGFDVAPLNVAVPEPGSLLLFSIVCLASLPRRR